ncbi:hypothetical protein ABBQ38_008054 [Trebouxia sp. C0009 RCD-2024]
MHVLALLQQAQMQCVAQDAVKCLDKQSLQAEAASEQLQVLALKDGASGDGQQEAGAISQAGTPVGRCAELRTHFQHRQLEAMQPFCSSYRIMQSSRV